MWKQKFEEAKMELGRVNEKHLNAKMKEKENEIAQPVMSQHKQCAAMMMRNFWHRLNQVVIAHILRSWGSRFRAALAVRTTAMPSPQNHLKHADLLSLRHTISLQKQLLSKATHQV